MLELNRKENPLYLESLTWSSILYYSVSVIIP